MKIGSFLTFLPFYLFWALFKLVPPRKSYAAGWHFARFVFWLFQRSRPFQVSMDNVILTGFAKTRREAYRLSRDAFGHFCGHITETIRCTGIITHDNWQDYVEVEMSETMRQALFEARQPVILATAHMGSWEAGITAISSSRPLFAMARMMDNPYLQRFLDKHDFRGGATIIPKKHGFTTNFMHRWTEERAAIALLFDQFASNGTMCDFFGYQVPVYTSPARLHLKTGAPILVGGFVRTGVLRYKIVGIGEPIVYPPTGNRDADVAIITQDMIHRIEEVIRQAPEQYLWMHRRWRGIPVPSVPKK